MSDKTALGISEELRQLIEALVEEVVLEGRNFDNPKKYLSRFCQTEEVDYNQLEKNLTEFIETAEELKAHESKGCERLMRVLGKDCYLSDNKMENIISAVNNQRGELESESLSNGYGVYTFYDGDRYEGIWKDGEMDGLGIMYHADGSRYEGHWEDGQKNGLGSFCWANSGDRYEGQWKDGKMNGQGIMYYSDGRTYYGGWKDNNKDGFGTFVWANGDRFEGRFEKGVINGQGKYFWTDGQRFEGIWRNGLRNGIGTHYWANGDKDTGELVNDKREGEWICIKADGKKLTATYHLGKIETNWH